MDEYHTQDILSYRLRTDGSLDPAYGDNGVARKTGRFFAGAHVSGAVASDGAATLVAHGDDMRVYRYTPQGISDANFDGDGVWFGTLNDVTEVHLAPSERRSGAGHPGPLRRRERPAAEGYVHSLYLCRPAGQRLRDDGVASVNIGSGANLIHAVTLANDGSILIAGQANDAMFLSRYWRDEAPAAQLNAVNLKKPLAGSYRFGISVRDDAAVDVSSIDSSDLRIIAPDGSSLRAYFMGTDRTDDGPLCGAQYKLAAPGGSWGPQDNGHYQVRLLSNHISDVAGNFSGGRLIGTFIVRIAATIQ